MANLIPFPNRSHKSAAETLTPAEAPVVAEAITDGDHSLVSMYEQLRVALNKAQREQQGVHSLATNAMESMGYQQPAMGNNDVQEAA